MAQTAQYVEFNVSELPIGHDEVRHVRVYGFEEQKTEPRDIRPLAFKGRVGEIEDYGKSFEKLSKAGSITAGEEAALFNVYLLAKRGLVKPTKVQSEYLDHLFSSQEYCAV